MSLGLEGALGTQAIGTTLEDVFAQRLKAAELQQRQQHDLAQQAIEQKKLAQEDAYHRLAMQEAADRIKQQAKAQADADELKQHAQAEKDYGLIPPNTPLSPQTASRFAAHGIAPELMPKEPISNEAIQPPAAIMAPGTPAAGPMPGTVANSPAPGMQRQIRGLTAIEAQQKSEGDAQDQLANDPSTDPTVRKFLQLRRILPKGENPPAELFKDPNAPLALHKSERLFDVANPLPHEKKDKLTKVEHRDPETGKTIIEWLPESELRGRTFAKGVTGATETRLASAAAVNQTGDDIIAKLSDPTVAAMVGPALGRANTLRDFIGNPPPEFSDLAGAIESYALANMGVHGMRSAQGAEQIKKLMDKKHTPESLIATIQGLSKFSQHFMENEGRAPAKGTSSGSGKRVMYDMNGDPVK